MKRIILLLAAMACFCSCERAHMEEASLQGSGTVRTRLAIERSAGVNAEQLLQGSVIKIYNGDFSGMIRQYKYPEMPSEIILNSGSYRMTVEAGEIVKENPDSASWNLKSYKGSKNFNVVPGESGSVELSAGICNVVSIVKFDASLDEYLQDDYTFTIGTDLESEGHSLTYTAAESGHEGYFIVDNDETDLVWHFTGKTKSDRDVVADGSVKAAQRGKSYTLTPKYISNEGYLNFGVSVSYDVEEIKDLIVFEPVSTSLVESARTEIWAAHATVHANVDEGEFPDPSKIKFAYSSDGSNWLEAGSSRDAQGEYSGLLKGLTPSTTYTYKLVIDGQDVANTLTLTTDAAPQLPNYTFETISNAESNNWTSFYDPNSSDPRLQTKFWDSGSSGSAGMLGSKYAICFTDSSVPDGIGSTKSARLQSTYAVVKFAAGNLFVGEFAGLVGTSGGKVNFGRPWSGARPSKVRFWYKYLGGKVEYECQYIKKTDYDICDIKVAIGTWPSSKYGGTSTCPVQVNTTDVKTFWDYTKLPETIAYCEFEEIGTGSLGEWKQVTIPLTYYSETEYPTIFVVSAAASKYGDYFAGSSISALYLDNFELIYE